METNYDKFFEWLLSGAISLKQLRRKIKKELHGTVNQEFRKVMIRITLDEEYAEELLGMDKPDWATA